MNKLFLILIILSIAVTSLQAQPVGGGTDSKDSRLMIINAYSKDIFIKIDDSQGDILYQTDAMPPNDITRMFSTPEDGFYFISYKFNEADNWTTFYDAFDDDDYMIQLKAGQVCAIIVNRYCMIDEHTLVIPDSSLPVVCFCNISPSELTRMEIGTDYMSDFVAFTTDISANGLTDFTAIDSGDYGLFWESIASTAKDEFTWLPKEDDDSIRLLPFENNNIYVFCVFDSDANRATLFDITP